MRLSERYRRLTFWNKLGFWGSVASLAGLSISLWPLVWRTRPGSGDPLRVTYLLLEGIAVDTLQRGFGSGLLGDDIKGTAYVVPNSVLRYLQTLTVSFSGPLGPLDQYYFLNDGVHELRMSPIGDRRQQFLVPTQPSRDSFDLVVERPTLPYLSDSTDTAAWRFDALGLKFSYNNTGFDWLRFWRPATRDDLEVCLRRSPRHTYARFLAYISREFWPMDLALVHLAYEACGENGMRLWLEPRVLKVRVLMLENVSDAAIRVGPGAIRRDARNGLRKRESDLVGQVALSTLLPSGVLLPTERIVIPLETVLAFHGRELPVEFAENDRKVLAKKVLDADGTRLDDPESPVLSSSVLARTLKVSKEPRFEAEYAIGPTERVEWVTVDDKRRPIRAFDPRVVVLESGSEAGSCPYLYTWDGLGWRNEGHVLYGADGPTKKQRDTIQLQHFDGRLTIREEDPETSFIDEVEVRDIVGGGKYHPAGDTRLLREDAAVVVLRRGQSLLMRFPGAPLDKARRYEVTVSGYYEADASRTSERPQPSGVGLAPKRKGVTR